MQAAIYCILQEHFCNTIFLVNVQNIENIYHFLWCTLVDFSTIGTYRERL